VTELVEPIARGWPGVKEDSSSDQHERRANAAGCVRSLAQLANKGRLPREVLASFPAFDAINRALLIRAEEREWGGKFDELHAAERALRSLDQAGKGKENENEKTDPERSRLEARIEALRNDSLCVYRNFTPEVREPPTGCGRPAESLAACMQI